MNKRNILLTPGPTPLPPEVLEALSRPIIHHRTREYRKIFGEVSDGLKDVFRTANPVYTFTASGTGAMEASIVNFLSPGDAILVVSGGKFGERFAEIAASHGIECDSLKVPYGEALDAAAVERQLASKQYRVVYTTLLETSTCVVNDIQAVGRILAKTDALLAVDAISGLLADRLETDQWKVDLVISGSQKALMLPPGLAFLSVSEKARKAMSRAKLPRFYFDLALYEKALKDQDTPFTPAINVVIGLREALDLIRKRGVDNILKECDRLARLTRAAVQALGLELFAKVPSSGATAAKVPAGIDGGKLLNVLQDDFGVVMAGGQGEMKGKIFRVAHMGCITQEDLITGFECLEEVLWKMGYRFEKGASLKVLSSKVGV